MPDDDNAAQIARKLRQLVIALERDASEIAEAARTYLADPSADNEAILKAAILLHDRRRGYVP